MTKYFYQPWWNFCASLPPSWMSPNQLTLIGVVWMYAYSFMEALYNPSMASPNAIPNWVFFVISSFHFIGHTFDGIDGKVARKTGLSGPVGEILDHGLDNLNHHCLSMAMVSTLSMHVFDSPFMRFLFVFSLQINVIALHSSKLVQGSLEFPYYVDASHLLVSIIYFCFGYYGLDACFSWTLFGWIGLRHIVIFVALISTNLSTLELFYKAAKFDSTTEI